MTDKVTQGKDKLTGLEFDVITDRKDLPEMTLELEHYK